MVVEILVAEAECQDGLLEEFGEGVFDLLGIAVIGEPACELGEEAERGFDFAEEESPALGGNRGGVEACDHLAVGQGLEGAVVGGTPCQSVSASWAS